MPRVYLSGAIEYAPDRGRSWREAITPFLLELGHEVYDPARDERKNLTPEEQEHFRGWKKSDLPRFQAVMRKIIAYDLDWVEHRSDYLIAYWDDYAARGAGTQAELTLAHRRGLPVWLVLGQPVERTSGWILGCATEIFTEFEVLRSALRRQYVGHAAAAEPTLL